MKKISKATIKKARKLLTEALKEIKLPTENEGWRQATADEFMFMEEDEYSYSFKHVMTRNYLYLVKEKQEWSGKEYFRILIPLGEPFGRGYFEGF